MADRPSSTTLSREPGRADPIGACVRVEGVVQGVGFRPFVYSLAQRLHLRGWVRNTSAGVEMQVDASPAAVDRLQEAIRAEAPPLARIDRIQVERGAATGFQNFEIRHSEAVAEAFQPISPDVSLCDDCRRELQTPQDRRYRYPFINCTNCGPRFTIIQDLPYDRPLTTMAEFELCPSCAREYEDPSDRRFHAQPVACPRCGPHLWLEVDDQPRYEREQALQAARQLLLQGKIVAIMGLGGFHLACDAFNRQAVRELRRRKGRSGKPFALMMADLAAIEDHCRLSAAEREPLQAPVRPIVLLEKRDGSQLAPNLAPGQRTLGVMLPYTPLHELLLEREAGFPEALVMTSGNRSAEPIAYRLDQARRSLRPLTDSFLLHNRPIASRCDDSVVRSFRGDPLVLRRARGYAPYPIRLRSSQAPLLATGAELKNTFCLIRDEYAFISHHIGDLENYDTLRSFERAVDHYQHLFRVTPEAIALDLHPNYLASRYGQERAERESLPAFRIQHHHAHIAACLAENGMPGNQPVIGLSFDGTGYGPDGAIWGGEVLLADMASFQRPYHLRYAPLPGGDVAVRQPWRMALSWLREAGIDWSEDLAPVAHPSAQAIELLGQQLEAGLNTANTSSVGRLFDAVAALAGVRQVVSYEAQAAMELEARVDPDEAGAYAFAIEAGTLDPRPVFQQIVTDLRTGSPVASVAARFHNGLGQLCLQVAEELRRETGIRQVALSGGVWQNMALLERAVRNLERGGFEVILHRQVPPNDGGLSLGQAVIAAQALAGVEGTAAASMTASRSAVLKED